MEKLKTMGTIVYLKLSLNTIASRLGDLKARGVALKDGYTLKDLYEERTPLYEKYADIAVDLDGLSVLECAEKVCKAVQQ